MRRGLPAQIQGIQVVSDAAARVNMKLLETEPMIPPFGASPIEVVASPNPSEEEESIEEPTEGLDRIQKGVYSPPNNVRSVEAASPSPTKSFHALQDSFAVGTSTSYIPPDTWGAVGLSKILVTLNNNVRVLDKSTGATISTVSLNTFWSSTGATGVFDPRVLYDPYNNRWIITATSNAASTSSSILVGVSDTDDPGGTFHLWRVKADAGNTLWADFPCVGFNRNWVAVSVNMFAISGNTFSESRVLTLAYDSLRAGRFPTGGGATLFTGIPDFTVQPCATYSATEDTLFAPNHNNSAARNYRLNLVRGTPTAPVYVQGAILAHSVLGAWTQPGGDVIPQTPEPSPGTGTAKINCGDARILNAVYRGGGIYYAQTVGLPAGRTSATVDRTAVQWVVLNTAGSFVQGGRIDDATATPTNGGKWYAFGSICVNVTNDLLVGFTQFASNQWPSAGYTFKGRGDAAGTMRDTVIFKRGVDYYHKTFSGTSNRWGDYSYSQVDPSDDFLLWTIQEYSLARVGTGNGSGRWDSWWAQVTPPDPLPIELASFVATASGPRNVVLEWSTVSEVQNLGFEVQKSPDVSAGFSKVLGGFVSGRGTTLVRQDYRFRDTTAVTGVWYYRLKQLDLDGVVHMFDPLKVEVMPDARNGAPDDFTLLQNYPNPFNPSTVIRYGLPRASDVTLEIYDLLGQRIATLVREHQESGYHEVTFRDPGLASGMYVYRFRGDSFSAAKRFLLVK